ncbi:hypothetical protein GALMADRAFT_720134 [Galerina marginata CBS 339.88]|uniref:Uncharacterized protein n=1 Tax=Galerina marginata (strain CBS 339.88) TaxID=685588 RepID=A0A067TXD6_GALM3|nr:hypothetical protein GALMADRAFT_720134 [Galerina marginata CBS 339.88]
MKFLLYNASLVFLLGLLHAAHCSPASSAELNADAQKQECGSHRWFAEQKCPEGRHARYNGHWDCCNFLTETEKEQTTQRREKEHQNQDKATDHGRCMGKASLMEPKCTSGEFTLSKLGTTNLWDCCKSLTPAEERRTGKRTDDIKHACHAYGFENENRGFFIHKYSCFKGRYAKKIDPNSSGQYQSQWECCPELTDGEKKIGDHQREVAEKDARVVRERLAQMREDDRKRQIQREKNRQTCEKNHVSIRKNNPC